MPGVYALVASPPKFRWLGKFPESFDRPDKASQVWIRDRPGTPERPRI